MSRELAPPPARDLPPGRHDHVREVVMRRIDRPQRTRRRRRLVVLTAGLVMAMLGASVVQAARLNVTLEDLLNDPSLLFAPGGGRYESLVGVYPGMAIEPHETSAAIDRLSAEIALPPGVSWERLHRGFEANPTLIDELGLRSIMEFQSFCQWTRHWLNATDAGDSEGAALALAALVEFPNSPVLRATDGGGGLEIRQRIANDAQRGDLSSIRAVWSRSCDPDAPTPGQ